MPSDDLVFRVGEVKRISHKIASEDGSTFSISSVAAYIYNSAGTAVVDGTAGGVTAGTGVAAAEHEIFYLWNNSAGTAGTYTYQLRYVVGTQTLTVQGEATVLPLTSKYDKYVRRIIDWVLMSEAGDAQQLMSDAQLRDAALEAVRVYSTYKPRRVLKDAQSLTANVWEYSLWSEWEDRFSMVEYFEYPIDATNQKRPLLTASTDLRSSADVLIDEPRGKWLFRKIVPATGETYRAAITCRHTLSDATDTVTSEEPADFDAVAEYAAGIALEQVANKFCGTEGQGIEAAVVNYRDKASQYSTQARRLRESAVRKWRAAYVVM